MTGLTALFNGPYDEALALVVEARDYVAYRSDVDQKPLPPGVRLQASFESLRMTTRLTQVMAWLLAQKALYAGEITLNQLASAEFALGGEAICADNAAAENHALPRRLRGLLERSHSLYQRIARLDLQVRRAVDPDGVDALDRLSAAEPDEDGAPDTSHADLYAALDRGSDANGAGVNGGGVNEGVARRTAAPVVSIATWRPHPTR